MNRHWRLEHNYSIYLLDSEVHMYMYFIDYFYTTTDKTLSTHVCLLLYTTV